MVKHWQQPTNCLSVFDHFVTLALKSICISGSETTQNIREAYWRLCHSVKYLWVCLYVNWANWAELTILIKRFMKDIWQGSKYTCLYCCFFQFNPTSAKPTKWSNTFQFADELFAYVWPFVGLALKGLM